MKSKNIFLATVFQALLSSFALANNDKDPSDEELNSLVESILSDTESPRSSSGSTPPASPVLAHQPQTLAQQIHLAVEAHQAQYRQLGPDRIEVLNSFTNLARLIRLGEVEAIRRLDGGLALQVERAWARLRRPTLLETFQLRFQAVLAQRQPTHRVMFGVPAAGCN